MRWVLNLSEVDRYEKNGQDSYLCLHLCGSIPDHGVCRIYLESWERGQFLCGDDECDCDKYIGKERDGGCADREERNRRDVYGGGSECDLYGKGIWWDGKSDPGFQRVSRNGKERRYSPVYTGLEREKVGRKVLLHRTGRCLWNPGEGFRRKDMETEICDQ